MTVLTRNNHILGSIGYTAVDMNILIAVATKFPNDSFELIDMPDTEVIQEFGCQEFESLMEWEEFTPSKEFSIASLIQ